MTNKELESYLAEYLSIAEFNDICPNGLQVEGKEEIEFKGQILKNPDYIEGKTGRNSRHQLAQAFQITAYPPIVFLDEKGDPIVPLPGYKSPQQLELYLKLFLNKSLSN